LNSIVKHLFDLKDSFPDLIALKIGEQTISYAELIEKSMLVAASLDSIGARRETVGLVGQRNTSSYIGILGILFAGCSFTPINPKYNPTKISSILRESKIRFLVGDPVDINQLESSILNDIETIILPEGDSSKHKSIKCINDRDFNSLFLLEKPKVNKLSDLAYINYTSGSTGKPKGVMVTHGNLISFLSNMRSIYFLELGFRASQTFDLSFDPSVSDIFFTWANKGVLCVLPENELMVPTDFIIREEITYWNSVPSIARFMLNTGNLNPNSFPMLQYSMFCGEQFPVELAKAWRLAAPNSTIENLYGPTEATIYISRYNYSRNDENKDFHNGIVPIGQPFPSHSVGLIDDENQRVSDSRQGEIIFSGPQLAKGYLNNEEKTAKSFCNFDWDSDDKLWYKTGDLGFFNCDGNLECIGRKDSQIKLAGRRIEIGEIESMLGKFEKTKGAIVVPTRNDQEIVNGCVGFLQVDISIAEIKEIRKQSTKYLDTVFFPKKLYKLDEIPLTQSGKINRNKLEKLAKHLEK
jgi:amino acid adenylation domain-containing protein